MATRIDESRFCAAPLDGVVHLDDLNGLDDMAAQPSAGRRQG